MTEELAGSSTKFESEGAPGCFNALRVAVCPLYGWMVWVYTHQYVPYRGSRLCLAKVA